jgi:hypothetical protein
VPSVFLGEREIGIAVIRVLLAVLACKNNGE